jgi:hypothetical protein
MPPWETLRYNNGDLVFRVAEPEDAEALYELMTHPDLPFLLDANRPLSVDQLRENLTYIKDAALRGEPANGIRWVLEVPERTLGMFTMQLRYMDKSGGDKGMPLRSANWMVYLHPDVLRQGYAARITGVIELGVETTLVRHFGVEQLVAWIDDTNENARMMVTGYGFEGPLNHNSSAGLGFYRRPTRPDLATGPE